MDNLEIAVCGLNCKTCEIRLAPFDNHAAEELLEWFRSQGWLSEDEGMPEVLERKMYCTGCRGSREIHWSSDCWILICCVDQHGLDNCSECQDFPCDRLIEWAEQDPDYQAAFERLTQLNQNP